MNKFSLLLLMVLMLLAACQPTPATPAPGSAAPREPFVVGWVTDVAGPARDTYFPEYEGFATYMRALNEQGGIDGHPVDVRLEDSGVDPAKAAAAARKLIEQDRVILLLGFSTERTQPPVYEVARSANIPVITGHSARPEMFPPAEPLLFTTGHVFEANTDHMVLVSEKVLTQLGLGTAKVGCYVHEGPAADAVCGRRLKGYAEKTSLRPAPGYVTAPVATTDFAPYAQKLLSDKPDVVWVYTIASHAVGMGRALRAAGFNGPILVSLEASPEYVVEQIGGRIIGFAGYLSPNDPAAGQVPEMARFLEAVRKYGTQTKPSVGMVRGWAMGLVVEAALRRCGFPCPGERLAGILNELTVDQRGLSGGPIAWTGTDHYGCRFWTGYELSTDGNWRRLTDWVRFCPRDVFYPVK